jgi:hypothetical protein
MLALRHAAETRPGFAERPWHDALLAHGAPPMRHVADLLATTGGAR